MKLKNLIIALSTVVGTSAIAGGIECKTCPCPAGVNYIEKTYCNIKAPGQFCINNSGHIQGWSISNESTYFIDNFAGMPNPNTAYYILPFTTDSSFSILEMKRSGEVVSSHGPFQWIGLDAITDGINVYEMDLCN